MISHLQLLQPRPQRGELSALGGAQLRMQLGAQLRFQLGHAARQVPRARRQVRPAPLARLQRRARVRLALAQRAQLRARGAQGGSGKKR